jgi:hypothetical protein
MQKTVFALTIQPLRGSKEKHPPEIHPRVPQSSFATHGAIDI